MIENLNNNIKSSISKIFNIFIVMLPILDALLGIIKDNRILMYCEYLVKLLFLGIIIYYMFFIDKKSRKYLIALFIYSALYFLVNVILKPNTNIIYELQVLIKFIYFPVILVFTLNNINIDKKYFALIFIEYLLLIFIPNILHIGNDSYAITKEGSIGFFLSANMTGNILSIIFPIFIIYSINEKRKKSLIVFTLIYIYTLLTMGTKGPLLCIVILIIYYLIYIIVRLFQNKKYKTLLICLVSIMLVICIIIKNIPKTVFYKNLVVHLEFLNIHSIKELFTLKNIDHFIFGSRFAMLKESFELYNNSPIINKLFGIGYISNNQILKTCEMDYFVLLIHQGILGFIIIYGIYFKQIYEILKNYFRNFSNNFMDIKKGTLFLTLLISILCAFFIGHTLDVPSVSIFVSLIITMCIKEFCEGR